MKMKMPDRKFLGGFAAGFLWGAVAVFLAGTLYLRHSLLDERECVMDFDKAVKEIPARAAKLQGWTVQPVSCALPKASDGTRMQIFKLCQPEFAKKMIDSEPDRKISCAVPCALAVYEKGDGRTYVSRLNMSLLGRLLGGEPSRTLPQRVAPDQEFILQGLAK